ncbi:MAG TPA: 2-hydroxyacyl-CoA dehydratase [Dehalococcoidia bacterium]|nr:2-hydroxyacyl-CoA dehydratase [Dehalococcoidia bacterium]
MPEKAVVKGLAAAERLYQDYGVRARELKKQGQKILGYLCAFVPLEIVTAAGFMPFRIKGDVNEPITKADTEMETIVCPLVRSCFDMALKGNYDFLEGIVIPHACDSICRTYDVWKYTLNLPYAHFINMPHTTGDSSLDFYRDILNTFRTSLGRFAGKEISDQELARAVELHNRQRAKVRELYELRKASPPLISGEEVARVLIAAISIPVAESIELLGDVIEEVGQRGSTPAPKKARIMVIGAQVDSIAFIKLIEDSGAWVVADDLCPGAREFMSSVDLTADPIEGIAERYLRKVKCGRTYREMKGNYEEDLEDRFGHMRQMIDDFKVDGVVLYIYKYCDPFGFEVPQIKSYIEAKGTPVLYLEDEYSMSTIGRLRTRVQAFLEMLG